MNKIVTLAMLLTLLGLTACNTVGGVARDTWGAARYVGGAIVGEDN